MLVAGIALPLVHCGLCVPPFGTPIHNVTMPGHGERGWQKRPEEIGAQAAEYALKSCPAAGLPAETELRGATMAADAALVATEPTSRTRRRSSSMRPIRCPRR